MAPRKTKIRGGSLADYMKIQQEKNKQQINKNMMDFFTKQKKYKSKSKEEKTDYLNLVAMAAKFGMSVAELMKYLK